MIDRERLIKVAMMSREFLLNDGGYDPRLVMFTEDPDPSVKPIAAMLPFHMPVDPREVVGAIGLNMPETTEAIFVAETWYVAFNASDEKTYRPSEHPDRSEAIILCALDLADREFLTAIDLFHREKDEHGNEQIVFDNEEPFFQEAIADGDPFNNPKVLLEAFFRGVKEAPMHEAARWN